MQDYLLNLAILICINASLAVTLNFIMGYAGIYSLAHSLFFGIGAYAAAWVSMQFSPSLFLVIPFVICITTVLSLLLALPALRVRGEYFIAASLGLQMLGVTVITEWKSVTGGLAGVIGIPQPTILGHVIAGPVELLSLSLVVLAAILITMRALTEHSFGRSLRAIRDSESAAYAAGKNVAVIKTLAVVFSSSLAAVGGAMYAFYLGFINVESFTMETSVLLMAMVIIGGAGTLFGPVIGAALLMLLPMAFSYLPFLPSTEIGSIQQIAYGLAMVLLMVLRPGGIMGARRRSVR